MFTNQNLMNLEVLFFKYKYEPSNLKLVSTI